jgi:two-component system phosphate regulon sensor histidine kinase PhoR
MKNNSNAFRKNFSLIMAFLGLLSVTFIIALAIAYKLTSNYVENEFASKKIDVLEQTIKPYNDFFLFKIPEITNYNGFLDSTSAAKYASSVFKDFSFVKRIAFYEVRISNNPNHKFKDLNINISGAYQYFPGNIAPNIKTKRSKADTADFNIMADKFGRFIELADTTRVLTQAETFKIFYDIKPDKISYLNIPRLEELRSYRELQKLKRGSISYKQNMMTFFLDPFSLNVRNSHPELYQDVAIQPVVYDPLDNESGEIRTEVALPGAFSDYKLYFRSKHGHLSAETSRRFMPIAGIVLLVYVFMAVIVWLIYRNVNVNLKLYKLQYDFINNFTHEFKTPVSVIKIAGSNLKGDSELTERQRKHYGKILDEEADKLNDLMNKLLSFTQLENRSIQVNKQETDLEPFIKNYIETFSIKYPDFKLKYRLHDVTSFYSDPVLLGSIFQNLIENAYKYSKKGSKELFMNIYLDRKNIIFSFRDKGIGIEKNEINNIFKKFYRIENQYNQNGSVGLGLAFCKELVNFMNGEISVNSIINEGSEFIITLPYEQ